MNAAEFRCLLFSLRRNRSAEPSLDVLADEFREMAIEQSLVDPRLHPRVVRVWLDLFYNTAELKSVASVDRFEHLSSRNAEESLLGIDGNVFQQKIHSSKRIPSHGGNLLHRHAVFAHTKQRFFGGIA